MKMEPYRCTYSTSGSLEYLILFWRGMALKKFDAKTLDAEKVEVICFR